MTQLKKFNFTFSVVTIKNVKISVSKFFVFLLLTFFFCFKTENFWLNTFGPVLARGGGANTNDQSELMRVVTRVLVHSLSGNLKNESENVWTMVASERGHNSSGKVA